MNTPDFEVHIPRRQYDTMWEREQESDDLPFGEDVDDIDKMIADELGAPKRRRRKQRNRLS